MRFRSEAEISLFSLLFAFQDPTPVRIILGSLSFFLVVRLFFVRRRRVSLFLLFRCWGNRNRVAVCGSLCVSSSCTRPSPSTRTPLSSTSSRAPPAPVFFSRRLAVGGGFRSVLVLVGFSLFLSRALSLSLSMVRPELPMLPPLPPAAL